MKPGRQMSVLMKLKIGHKLK